MKNGAEAILTVSSVYVMGSNISLPPTISVPQPSPSLSLGINASYQHHGGSGTNQTTLRIAE